MKQQIKKQKGFTLIELIITVAIIGILSAIAVPSYNKSVMKGKRVDAKVALLRLAQMQESYFVQNLSYAKTFTQLGFSGASIESDEELYDIAFYYTAPAGCTGVSANPCAEYAFNATPDSAQSQANDTECTGFGIDHISRKYAIGGSLTAYGTSTAHTAKAKDCW